MIAVHIRPGPLSPGVEESKWRLTANECGRSDNRGLSRHIRTRNYHHLLTCVIERYIIGNE